jgi:hypothetical protein
VTNVGHIMRHGLGFMCIMSEYGGRRCPYIGVDRLESAMHRAVPGCSTNC